jgi:hypothetical protein
VRVLHHKTGELVPLPLSDRDGQLFPELTTYLDGIERLGVPIVVMKSKPLGKDPKINRQSLSCSAPHATTCARRRARRSYLII